MVGGSTTNQCWLNPGKRIGAGAAAGSWVAGATVTLAADMMDVAIQSVYSIYIYMYVYIYILYILYIIYYILYIIYNIYSIYILYIYIILYYTYVYIYIYIIWVVITFYTPRNRESAGNNSEPNNLGFGQENHGMDCQEDSRRLGFHRGDSCRQAGMTAWGDGLFSGFYNESMEKISSFQL